MIQELLNYQELDRQLKKIEQDIALNEDRKRAIAARTYIVEGEELAAKLDNRSIELVNAYSKLKKAYGEHAGIIEEYKTLCDTLTDEKEVSYLKKKVAQILITVKSIEKDLNALKSDMENTTKAFNDFKKRFVAAKSDYTKYKEKFDKFKESKTGEISKSENELEVLSKKIDKTLMEKYNKKRADKIFPVVVPLMGNMCGGCNTEIPLNAINKLKTANYIDCENCRRMIVKDN